jgi:hypothetical protein
MSFVMWNEVLSIWCMTPVFRGGLQWSPRTIGQVWGVAGIFQCGLQLWLIPIIVNLMGTWRAVIRGMLLSMPIMALLPWIALAQHIPEDAIAASEDLSSSIAYAEGNTLLPSVLPFALVFSLMSAMNFACQMVVVGMTIFIGNAVTTEYRARANSLAIGVQSLLMAFSPSLGGLIFTMGLQSTTYHPGLDAWEPAWSWPLGCHPVFLLCSLIQVPVCCIVFSSIPRSLENFPEEEKSPSEV